MSKINDTLRTVIADEVHLEYDYDTRQILIEEIENNSREQLQSVHFELAKSCTFHFAFKLDDSNFQFLGQLFKSDVKNIRKAVDAVIVCESNKKKYIFLVELKSKTSDGLVGKFKSTRLFINYLSDYLEVYHELDLDNFEIKSILFDRKVRKGKPEFRIRGEQTFFHQGFGHHRNNVARIQNFY